MNHKKLISFLFVLLTLSCLTAKGFLKTSGKNIVADNENVLLRGIGLGGWMLQEGYMMQTSSFASTQHELKSKISELIGQDGMELFYETWLANHCTKADIDSLASWGFNSVRLPMHYNLYTLPIEEEPVAGDNTWLNKGFELTDSLLSWCASNEMYLILDLHAAPGGQGKDKAISDYDDTKPSLWESALNRFKTVALWRKLARRYANEPWIGGYDLINETNWELPGNSLLRELYREITYSIREVDTTHIIFIEGNWFANDFTGLTPPWDDNMVYSFHKYWSYNKQADIQWMLDIRDRYDVPIWCGESGENSNKWFTDAIKLFEEFNIGWAWWPLKKVESISGPLSIIKTDNYQKLLDYWEGRAAKPSVEFATSALIELAENTRIENCEYHRDVIDAMIRQVQEDSTIPYVNLTIPGVIPAVHYDLGTQGEAYYDNDVADYHVSTGTWTGWNYGWAYRNDGVDIEKCDDSEGAPYNLGFIQSDEWIKYTIKVTKTDSYKVTMRVASENNDGALKLQLYDNDISKSLNVPNTYGWQKWLTLDACKVYIPKGTHSLKLWFINGGFNINQIKFEETGTGLNPSENQLPAGFQLKQNYPNPFNGYTIIPFWLYRSAKVKISIYDTCGRLVTALAEKEYPGGNNGVEWDGKKNDGILVATGMYYYQMRVEGKASAKYMLYIR